MRRSVIAGLCGLSLLVVSGCAMVNAVVDYDWSGFKAHFTDTQKRYTRLMRWSEFTAASAHVEPEDRKAFLAELGELGALRFSDYETDEPAYDRVTQTATVTVRYFAYREATLTSETFTEVQHWRRNPTDGRLAGRARWPAPGAGRAGRRPLTPAMPRSPAMWRPTILLVDDIPIFRDLIILSLSSFGRIVTAADDERALALVQAQPPSLVVAPYPPATPGQVSICEALKREPALAHVPVILLTPGAQPAHHAAAVRLGADDVLTKPLDRMTLLAAARRLLDDPRRARTAAGRGRDPRPHRTRQQRGLGRRRGTSRAAGSSSRPSTPIRSGQRSSSSSRCQGAGT